MIGILAACAVFPLFGFAPGFVAGWLTNVCGFRRGTRLRQMALSVPLSIAVAPILVFLPWRLLSVRVVWWEFGVIWAACLVLMMRRTQLGEKRAWIVGGVALAAWVVLALVSLPDLRIGGRLYYSTTTYDYLSRVPIAASLARQSKLPATSPFLNPGYPVTLRYHYLWFAVCALARNAGHSDTRNTVFAGTIWGGIGFLCVIALCLRMFINVTASRWRPYAIAFALLAVTGLDIFPVLAWSAWQLPAHRLLPSVEWWNVQVAGWLDAMLWVPHHMAALTAGFTAFLVLWYERRNPRFAAMAVAALALASAAGMSIYVTIVIAASLLVWIAWERTAIRAVMAAGLISLVLISPLFYDLSQGDSQGPLLVLRVRQFAEVTSQLANLTLLPLNYAIEFGVYGFAGILYWKKRGDSPTGLICATSLFIASFLSSSLGVNDLGFRGILPAQLVLLLWTALSFDRLAEWPRHTRTVLVVLAVIGISTTALDLFLMRFYTMLADVPALAMQDSVFNTVTDRRFGERNSAVEQAYTWIRAHTKDDAVVQSNPRHRAYQFGIYGDRRGLAVGGECYSYSGSTLECGVIKGAISPLYDGLPGADFAATCRTFPLAAIVVDSSDPVWKTRDSWIWRIAPAFANGDARVFVCGG